MQYRKVTCVGGTTCDLDLEPPSQRPCGGAPCPETTADNSTVEIERKLFTDEESKAAKTNTASKEKVVVGLKTTDGSVVEPETTADNVVLGESTITAGKTKEEADIPSSAEDPDPSPAARTTTTGSKEPGQHKQRHHRHKLHQRQRDHHLKQHNSDSDKGGKRGGDSEGEKERRGKGGPAVVSNSITIDKNVGKIQKDITDSKKDDGDDPTKTKGKEEEGREEEEEEEEIVEEQQEVDSEDDFEWYAGEWRKVRPQSCSMVCLASLVCVVGLFLCTLMRYISFMGILFYA